MTESASHARVRQLVQPLGPAEDSCAQRLRLALAMMEAGIDMMRMNLPRGHPGECAEQISARLNRWLEQQPHNPEFRDGMHRLGKHS